MWSIRKKIYKKENLMTTLEWGEVYHKETGEYFRETAREKARETKFVQRQSRITGELFLLAMVMTVYQYGEIKLDQLAAVAQEIEPKCDVSGQAFKERFNKEALNYLQSMFTIAMKMSVPSKSEVVPLL